MSAIDAAIAALYPVIILMGTLVWARYLAVVKELEAGQRTLVCSLLVMVATIVIEQVYYGLGRFTGRYIEISMRTEVIAFMKLGYILSFCYMLYAFWMIAPTRPTMKVPIILAGLVWLFVTIALMVGK